MTTFGPGLLDRTISRTLIKRREYASQLRHYAKDDIGWNDKSLATIKKKLRLSLRRQQEGRCIYCRRIILLERRNAYEDLEHFLDKSKPHYKRWTFSCVNLALSCRACNIVKGIRDLGNPVIAAGANYPNGIGLYKWLHPYFDDYHLNILVGKGWTYSVAPNAPAAVQAQTMINECGLGDIQEIEKHAEAIKQKVIRLTSLAREALKRGNSDRADRLLAASELFQHEHWTHY